jgi:hypothetical protein
MKTTSAKASLVAERGVGEYAFGKEELKALGQ